MEKYYYQEGVCRALSYLSLNPVVYEKQEDGKYHKKRMDCDCINKGKCDKTTSCQLFKDAPEIVEDNKIKLRDKKL